MMKLLQTAFILTSLAFLGLKAGHSNANSINSNMESLINSSKVNYSRGTRFNAILKKKRHSKTDKAKTEKLFEDSDNSNQHISPDPVKDDKNEYNVDKALCLSKSENPSKWNVHIDDWSLYQTCYYTCRHYSSSPKDYESRRANCSDSPYAITCINYSDFISMCQQGGFLSN